MRVKLYKYQALEKILVSIFDKNGWTEHDYSDLNEYVYLKSKYKQKINKVIIWRNTGIESGIGFYKEESYKGQQTIYSPWTEIYDIEIEDKALLRLLFKL